MTLQGHMRYWEREGREFDLAVAEASVVLFKMLPGDDRIALNITVVAEETSVPAPDDPDDKYDIAPSLTTQWMFIQPSDLTSRGTDALDGVRVTWRDPDESGPEAFAFERPAALYTGFYGGTVEMDLSLVAEAGTYRLRATGKDEFGQRFEIDTLTVPLVIGVRHETMDQNPACMAWLESHFDTSGMQVGWEKKGPAGDGWFDLYTRQK